VDLKDGARAQAMAEYQKLSQETDAPPNLRQRAAGIAEYLKANPDAGVNTASTAPPSLPSLSAPAPANAPAPAPAKGAPIGQGTNPQ
jgi:hypothetical protein